MESTEKSSNNKKVLVVGEIGVGKSYILNRLLNKALFKSGASVNSVTREITSAEATIEIENQTLTLTAFDTPGITDHKNARSCIDAIMAKIKTEHFNQLIIVNKYGRLSTDFYNNLEILERCLNGVTDSSVMLIINMVPKKRANDSCDLSQELEKLKDEIKRVFKFRLSACFNFLYELEEEDESANGFVLNQMRMLISSSDEYDFKCARTWSNIVNMVNKSYEDSKVKEELNFQLKKNLEDRIKKLNSILETKNNLVKFLDPLKDIATCANGFIANCDRFKILVPLHMLKKGSEKLIIQQHDELNREIEQLKSELNGKKTRLDEIMRNNIELAKDLEAYQKDIKKLEKLLPLD